MLTLFVFVGTCIVSIFSPQNSPYAGYRNSSGELAWTQAQAVLVNELPTAFGRQQLSEIQMSIFVRVLLFHYLPWAFLMTFKTMILLSIGVRTIVTLFFLLFG